MNRIGWLLGIIVVIILGLSAWQFSKDYERVSSREYRSYKGEAAENPLYAARIFLKRMGIPAQSITSLQGLTKLPDSDTVMIIDTGRSNISTEKISDLLDWVKQGGHLFAEVVVDWDYFEECRNSDEDCDDLLSEDPLQRALKVVVTSSNYIREDEKDEEEEEDAANSLFTHHQQQLATLPVSLPGVERKLTLATGRYLYHLSTGQSNDTEFRFEDTLYLLQRPLGEGKITLSYSLQFIENRYLGEADNAEILLRLIQNKHQHPQQVWLIHNEEMPYFLKLIWDRAWPMVLSLALLLFLWFFHVGQRFGPVISKQPLARRRLMEHVQATGEYYWANGESAKLLESTRSALQQRIIQVYPAWMHSDDASKTDYLVKQSGLDKALLHKLLFQPSFSQAEDFVLAIKQLEEIRINI